MIYILITIILFLLIFIKSKNSKRNITLWTICFVFICIAGFRYRVGSDALLYEKTFINYPTITNIESYRLFGSRWSTGFVIYFSLLKTICNSFVFVQLINAIIINYIIFLFIQKKTRLYFPAILLYFIYSYTYLTFDLMREGLSCSIGLLAYLQLEQKKYLYFLFFALVAFFIHTSAFIIFLYPLILSINLNHKKAIFIIAIIFLCSPYIQYIIDYCIYIIPITSIRILAIKYLEYAEIGDLSISRIILILFIYYYTVYIGLRNPDNIKDKIINLSFFSIILLVLNNVIPYIFRLNNYFLIFLFTTLSRNLETKIILNKNCKNKITLVLIIIFISVSPRLKDIFYNESTYISYQPYYSIFNKQLYLPREKQMEGIDTYISFDGLPTNF